MKNNAVKFGIIAGLITSTFTVIGGLMMANGAEGGAYDNTEIIGYSGIFLAYSMIVVGMIKERQQRGGALSYGQTLLVGIKISGIAALLYVAAWMIMTAIYPQILEGMFTMMEEGIKTGDLSVTDKQDQLNQMATWKGYYGNPLAKAGLTFMEIFPIGLGISLISAIFIFKKPVATSREVLDA
ncbi:MAG: hypothetical protein ACI8SE_001691 [Bacteroidia bacterium]|jgi:hypothetical protein